MPRHDLPAAALEWLVGHGADPVIMINPMRSVVAALVASGHHVIAVDAEAERAARFAAAMGADERLFCLVARPDQLPVQPCITSVVLLGGELRSPRSGTRLDRRLAYGQISRALQPGGWVGGWQIVRDDSVPWVRRLIRLMRSVDPDAMSAQLPTAHEELLTSKYFPRIERRDFRLWVPINRDGLVSMATSHPAVARLADRERNRVVIEARQIFDNAASMGELLLPYQLRCWRAHVDHHELTTPITFNDGALVIPI